MNNIYYAIWAFCAGALIPVMSLLNANLGKHIGGNLAASLVLFFICFILILLASLIWGGLPNIASIGMPAPYLYFAGFIMVFYLLSVTNLAPKFGIGNTILFIMIAQIIISSLIDNYGLLGMEIRKINSTRFFGILLMIIGLIITQSNFKSRSFF